MDTHRAVRDPRGNGERISAISIGRYCNHTLAFDNTTRVRVVWNDWSFQEVNFLVLFGIIEDPITAAELSAGERACVL